MKLTIMLQFARMKICWACSLNHAHNPSVVHSGMSRSTVATNMKPSPPSRVEKQIRKISTSTAKSFLSRKSVVLTQVLQEEVSFAILVVRRLEIVGRTINTQGFEVI